MAIVSFEQIERLTTDRVQSIRPGGRAQGPLAGGVAGNRSTVYDPVWGYFQFGQSTRFGYNATDTYQDVTEFTIHGTFTRNAQEDLEGVADDEAAFLSVAAKYDTLEELFAEKSRAQAPEDLAAWGTANDLRCIVLPEPLRDNQGRQVYAVPLSLQLEQTQFPNLLQYTARLREATVPVAKLLINSYLVDNASVTVSPPAPALARHRLTATAGAVLQLKHYEAGHVQVSCSVPNNPPDGKAVGDLAKNLVDSFEGGTVDIGVTYLQGTSGMATSPVWTGLDVDEGNVQVEFERERATVQVTARM